MSTNTHTPFPVANFSRRSLAALYDWLLVIGLMMVLSIPIVALLDDAIAVGSNWYRATLLCIVLFYFTGFWRWSGQTPGMRAWRLRLRATPDGPVSWQQAFYRFAAAWLSLLPAAAGYWWMLFDTGQRSWHDRISATQLVQEPVGPKKRPPANASG